MGTESCRSYADRIRRRRPSDCWHLDEVFLKIGGKTVYLWRAADDEGEVLDILVQSKRAPDRGGPTPSSQRVPGDRELP